MCNNDNSIKKYIGKILFFFHGISSNLFSLVPNTEIDSNQPSSQIKKPTSDMDLKKVLVSDQIDQEVIESLQRANLQVDYQPNITPQKLEDSMQDVDVLVVRSRTTVTKSIIESANRLKLIARAGVGIDNVDCEAASNKNVLVINAPSGNTMSACELTCSHLLTLARPTAKACESLRGGVWRRKDFIGNELYGNTLGIVGLGRIGREVGIRMKAFGMTIIGYDPLVPKEVATGLGFEFVSLEEIWTRSDYITFHVPIMDETYHMFNKAAIELCKTGVRVVNCARGGIIDEEALLEGLAVTHKVAGAALDVFEEEPPRSEELLHHQSVYVTPHLGASTHEAQTRVGREIVEQILELLAGRGVHGAINANKVKLPF